MGGSGLKKYLGLYCSCRKKLSFVVMLFFGWVIVMYVEFGKLWLVVNIIFYIILRIIWNYFRDLNSLELVVIEIVYEEIWLLFICLLIENYGWKESGK